MLPVYFTFIMKPLENWKSTYVFHRIFPSDSFDIDFNSKSIVKKKYGYYIMIRGTIHEEEIA